MRAVRAERRAASRRSARQPRTLKQEEMSVKTHGQEGVDASLTPEALAMIFGPKREADWRPARRT